MNLIDSRTAIGEVVSKQTAEFEKAFNNQMRDGNSACLNACRNTDHGVPYWVITVDGRMNMSTFIYIRDHLRKTGWMVLELIDKENTRTAIRVAVL